jgi:uncharacterized protein
VRVILDTNVLLSAVMKRDSVPARLLQAWRDGRFELVSCETQLAEVRDVSRRPVLRTRLRSNYVGTLVNEIRNLASIMDPVEDADGSVDPNDNYLLGLARASEASFLVTGDKAHLLSLERMGPTRIVTARTLVSTLGLR